MSQERQSILCVEDDEDTRYMMRLLLSEYGYETVIATSVEEAQELVNRGGFALIILDNWLIEDSGLELCKQIRTIDATTPILFYSGAGYKADIQAAMAAGAQDYLVKPDFEHLQDTIAQLIFKAKVKKRTR